MRKSLRSWNSTLRSSRRRIRLATPEHRERRQAFRQAVLLRDELCRMCGKSQATDAHHVLPAGRGGQDDPDRGVGLCRACHNWITDTVEGQREARVRGLLAEKGG